jgi:hypothetical protein
MTFSSVMTKNSHQHHGNILEIDSTGAQVGFNKKKPMELLYISVKIKPRLKEQYSSGLKSVFV